MVTQQSGRQEPLVHDLVHACAKESPSARAVVAEGAVLTYEALDARANAIASQLQALGVGPDVVVALYAGRSTEQILGALAILKAGGAYLPLDASYPVERVAFILDDARCRFMLCAPELAEIMAHRVENMTVLDSKGPRAAIAPASRVTADHLAYVIYTSGSTGQPKGVEITHASLLNLVRWHRRAFQVSSADRATQIASVGFDAAVWELWPYLTAGASIHLPADAVRSEPEALRDWLVTQQISISFVPTPMAERLLSLEWPRTALRVMLTGGDTLHSHPRPGLPFVLVNNYGPTECTVVATSGPVPSQETPDLRPAIGRPIDNTKVFVLDDRLQLVPAGTPGDLYVGGAGVARGYVNRPELTRERFIPDPFDGRGRLYKTGDLARILPDGQIAFLGRIDDQIKIRGFRIEPAEIVAALHAHPDVVASAVVASDGCSGEKRLVAYVVPAAGARPSPRDLASALRGRLPDYMVPSIFVGIDALPLGPHGKLDRRALPEPSAANTLRDSGFTEPRTPVERRVAGLVAALLGLDRVSVDDNFFLLGGNSLMGTQLIGAICDAFGLELSLRTIFDSPTVAELAAEVERLLTEQLAAMTDDEAERFLAEPGEAAAGS